MKEFYFLCFTDAPVFLDPRDDDVYLHLNWENGLVFVGVTLLVVLLRLRPVTF